MDCWSLTLFHIYKHIAWANKASIIGPIELQQLGAISSTEGCVQNVGTMSYVVKP